MSAVFAQIALMLYHAFGSKRSVINTVSRFEKFKTSTLLSVKQSLVLTYTLFMDVVLWTEGGTTLHGSHKCMNV